MENQYLRVNREKSVAIFCRIVLGTIFLTYGLDGFTHFLPHLPPSSSGARFLQALQESGYFYQFLKGVETLCGLLIIGNAFVPLALLVLSPIIVNILLYGIFLDPRTLYVPAIILACAGYLFWYYRDLFKIFLRYQFYTSPDTEGKAKVMVVDEKNWSSDHEESTPDFLPGKGIKMPPLQRKLDESGPFHDPS